ncbi:MAG: hypothetical protein KME21_17585 [Desmonostoc vinosum HA7617-LM4]|jgi:subtilase family serine protease|nr:hypothetical protein [Desmonostoc vinosum HA7617-LM4]
MDKSDLIVSSIDVPISAVLGETIPVSWTVTNEGVVSTLTDWYDYIYISDDEFLDFKDTFVSGVLTGENTPLAVGASYTINKDILLPSSKTGDRYLLFIADGGNDEKETDDTNNVLPKPVSFTGTDLVVSSAKILSSNASNNTISLSWTVTNQGAVSALADWYDYIYISNDNFLDYSDTFVGRTSITENTPLAAGASYTKTQDIVIPTTTKDARYLLFVTDRGNNQVEADNSNNVLAIIGTDLIVSSAQAPTSAVLGETINVSWTVTNQGAVATFSDYFSDYKWSDQVYISEDEFLDDSDSGISTTSEIENTPLLAGASYTVNQDITLNGGKAGDYYLLFVANDYSFGKRQSESDETNNVLAKPITLSAPDLVVTSANAPTSAVLGDTISVSWTLTNQGTVPAFPYYWFDTIYVSDDELLDDSDTLVSFIIREDYTPIAAGASYTFNRDILLPSTKTGDRFLLFTAFELSYNNRSEINETNNLLAKAITLNAPDLVVSSADAPTSAVVGETINVSWTVTNQSTFPAAATGIDDLYNSRSDNVYISSDEFLDESDTVLTSFSIEENMPLAAGASYTISKDIGLPQNRAGNQYLLFRADASNFQSESNKTNNILAKAINISAPDLVVTSANTPISILSGEAINVSWTVTNQGIVSALSGWYTSVYISDDEFLDDSDISLFGYSPTSPTPLLAAGASYTVSKDIFIPYTKTGEKIGDRYLLFVANQGNIPGESDTTNNVLAKPITIKGPDLTVSSAEIPNPAVLRETDTTIRTNTINVSYTITNQGTTAATNFWWDTIYLSEDEFFNFGDIEIIDTLTSFESSLAPGASYTRNFDVYIPSYALNYNYLLFTTDSLSFKSETDESNNVLAKEITFVKPDLIVSAAQTPTSVALGETINVSWTVTNQGAVSAFSESLTDYVYISDDEFLDNSDSVVGNEISIEAPIAAGASYTKNQDITLLDTKVGDRYLLFVTNGYQSQRETDESNNILAKLITINAPNAQVLNGTPRRDKLIGSNDRDIITGFQGADILQGGAGKDLFVYTSLRDAGDKIIDFVPGTDKIVLSKLFDNLNSDGLDYNRLKEQRYLSFKAQGSNTTILIDPDGSNSRSRPTTLLTVENVPLSSLTNADNFIF